MTIPSWARDGQTAELRDGDAALELDRQADEQAAREKAEERAAEQAKEDAFVRDREFFRSVEAEAEAEEDDTDPAFDASAIHKRPITSLTREQCIEEIALLLRRHWNPENEARVLLYLARRFIMLGGDCYGPLCLNDGRDSLKEAGEEGADLLFYLAKHALETEG